MPLMPVGTQVGAETRSRIKPRHFRYLRRCRGSPSWIRTNDQVINSHLLYR